MRRGDDVGDELPGDRSKLSGVLSAGVVAGLVLGAALATFVVQNTESTQVKWLVFEFRQPLWAVLLVTAAVTLVITELLGAARRRRKRKS